MLYTHAAAALIAGAVAFGAAWRVQAWRHDSAELARVEQTREVEKMRRQAAGKAATQHEADKTKTRTEFVTITERVRDEIEIEKVVYRNVCISAGGLRELANAARATGYTGEPGNGLPADPPSK